MYIKWILSGEKHGVFKQKSAADGHEKWILIRAGNNEKHWILSSIMVLSAIHTSGFFFSPYKRITEGRFVSRKLYCVPPQYSFLKQALGLIQS